MSTRAVATGIALAQARSPQTLGYTFFPQSADLLLTGPGEGDDPAFSEPSDFEADGSEASRRLKRPSRSSSRTHSIGGVGSASSTWLDLLGYPIAYHG